MIWLCLCLNVSVSVCVCVSVSCRFRFVYFVTTLSLKYSIVLQHLHFVHAYTLLSGLGSVEPADQKGEQDDAHQDGEGQAGGHLFIRGGGVRSGVCFEKDGGLRGGGGGGGDSVD